MKMIYHQSYMTLVIDEFHVNWRPSKQFRVLWTLRDKAAIIVGMTATPVIMSPMVCADYIHFIAQSLTTCSRTWPRSGSSAPEFGPNSEED